MLIPKPFQRGTIAVLFAFLPTLLQASASRPIAGVSGVTGEGSCSSCHSGGSGGGSVKVDFPGGLTYAPGVKQHLVVTVADPNQKRWGFQLAARPATDSKAQAGAFTMGSDGYTQTLSSGTLQYIEQTSSGTRNGQTVSATFGFDWTPPATGSGSVVIYVAGLAANGDGGTRGDSVYLQKYTLAILIHRKTRQPRERRTP